MTVTPESMLSLLPFQMSIQQEPSQQLPPPSLQQVPNCINHDMFVFNTQSVDYDNVPSFNPNEKAFSCSKKDKPLLAPAVCKAKSRAE